MVECRITGNMSEVENNEKFNEVGVAISEGNVRSQRIHFPTDTSGGSSKKQNRRIKLEEEKEDAFDSGILSGSNLSSGVISEADIKCAEFSTEYGDESNVLRGNEDQQRKEKTFFCDNNKLETDDSMKSDSGIDIEVSDQFSGSKTDNSGPIQKETSPTIREELQGFTENFPTERSASLSSGNICEFIFQQDDDGDTPLHLAIIHEYEALVKSILKVIPDSHYLDIRNYYRQTCLHLSVIMNHPNITRLLLLAGAKTGIEDKKGNTALHLACQANHLQCVTALLQPPTNYEKKYVAFKYKPEIDSPCQYLNEYNYDGLSCVHIAAVHKDLNILHQLLFIYGADVNIRECKSGCTVLHESVKGGNLKLVNYLLQHSGVDIEKRNYARLTPYQLSSYCATIGQILLHKGATRLCGFEGESDKDDLTSSDEGDSDDDLR